MLVAAGPAIEADLFLTNSPSPPVLLPAEFSPLNRAPVCTHVKSAAASAKSRASGNDYGWMLVRQRRIEPFEAAQVLAGGWGVVHKGGHCVAETLFRGVLGCCRNFA